jgi:hypothetical protein
MIKMEGERQKIVKNVFQGTIRGNLKIMI